MVPYRPSGVKSCNLNICPVRADSAGWRGIWLIDFVRTSASAPPRDLGFVPI